jgi:hypothetical protein
MNVVIKDIQNVSCQIYNLCSLCNQKAGFTILNIYTYIYIEYMFSEYSLQI